MSRIHRNRNHHTNDIMNIAKAIKNRGKAEAKFNDGLWHKVVNGKHFTAQSRSKLRTIVKGAK